MAISYVGRVTGTTSATLPTHQAGDLLVCFAFSRTGASITLPSGWTNKVTTGSFNGASSRLSYRVATAAGTASGTWTNATSVVFHVYRGATGLGGNQWTTSNTNSGFYYPSVTLARTDNTSWIAYFAGHQSTNTALETAPTGATNRSTLVNTAEVAGHDTNGTVASSPSPSVTLGGTDAGWHSHTVELVAPLQLAYSNTGSGSQNYSLSANIWTPALLSVQNLWYVSDSQNNTVVSGNLDTLYDKSGGGKHATPHTGTVDRAARTNTLNGRTVFTIDPASGSARGFLRATTVSIDNATSGTTIFSVSKLSGSGNSTLLWEDVGDGYYTRRTVTLDSGSGLEIGGRRIQPGEGYVSTSAGSAYDTSWHILAATYDHTNAQLSATKDGSSYISPTSWQSTGVTNSVDSQYFAIGFHANGSGGFDSYGNQAADVAEIVVVRGVLSSTDRQKMEGYLAWQWGLQGSLPGGHPYASAPPLSTVALSLSYSNSGTGSQSYALSAATKLAYSNAGAGSNTYAPAAKTNLAYLNSGAGSNSYTAVFKASLAYLNAGTGTNSYSLSAVTSLSYSNSGVGSQSYTLTTGSTVYLAYSNGGAGAQSYNFTTDAQPPAAPTFDGQGGRPPRSKQVNDLDNALETLNQKVDEPINEPEPVSPDLTVEAKPIAIDRLVEVMTPAPGPALPPIDLDALRAELANLQQERLEMLRQAQEEEAAAMLLMQVAVRRRRSFLRR